MSSLMLDAGTTFVVVVDVVEVVWKCSNGLRGEESSSLGSQQRRSGRPGWISVASREEEWPASEVRGGDAGERQDAEEPTTSAAQQGARGPARPARANAREPVSGSWG